MNNRDAILSAVRGHQPPAVPRPVVPLFDEDLTPLWPRFVAALERMGGKLVVPAADADPGAIVRELFPDAAIVCSATPEVEGTRPLSGANAPKDLADVDVGIARAPFGVAETGSVWFGERSLVQPAVAFLAQHFVVLLDPEALVANLHTAYRRPEFRDAGYAVLVTGPSATADIEGVLIHGAQGVRSLTIIARPVPVPV
jgi:L-lactate dehydrogenase complex protein LldG